MDILVLLGSESDMDVGREIVAVFDDMGVNYDIHIASAHRTPEKVKEHVANAEANGAKAIIAGAGLSAHLAGVVASITLLPVIGIPMESGPLKGIDALLSTVNMPGGVPVACVSIGKAGGKNAALLAIRILALSDKGLAEKLAASRDKMALSVEEADARLKDKLKPRNL